jgi:hypothetical protein
MMIGPLKREIAYRMAIHVPRMSYQSADLGKDRAGSLSLIRNGLKIRGAFQRFMRQRFRLAADICDR